MRTVTAIRPAVEIPTDSDGLIVPRLIPVAALLCVEGYSDRARERVLARLADGISPRECCRDGALEWADLREVERLTGWAPPAVEPAPPPAAVVEHTAADEDWYAGQVRDLDAVEPCRPYDDFPRPMDAAAYRRVLRELVADHAARGA